MYVKRTQLFASALMYLEHNDLVLQTLSTRGRRTLPFLLTSWHITCRWPTECTKMKGERVLDMVIMKLYTHTCFERYMDLINSISCDIYLSNQASYNKYTPN